jgi:glycerol uptake facilitator-like aquaporin
LAGIEGRLGVCAEYQAGAILSCEVPGYLIAQIAGAYVGVACAHLMFGLPLFSASQPRSQRRLAGLQRVRGDSWSAIGDLGLFAATLVRCAVCVGRLYHRCVLVHCINIIR